MMEMTLKIKPTFDDLKMLADSEYFILCYAPEVDAMGAVFQDVPNYYMVNKESSKIELTGNSIIMMYEFLHQADSVYKSAKEGKVSPDAFTGGASTH